MTDIITALYHAASSEEPDTMDGPSLCDYYQRREETEQTRTALWWPGFPSPGCGLCRRKL